MEAYFHLIWLVVTMIGVILAAFKIDPDKKYRSVVIRVLTQVKDVTPGNIDEVIDLIIGALEGEGLDVEKKAVRQIILEIREDAEKNPVTVPVKVVGAKKTPVKKLKDSTHVHNPKEH